MFVQKTPRHHFVSIYFYYVETTKLCTNIVFNVFSKIWSSETAKTNLYILIFIYLLMLKFGRIKLLMDSFCFISNLYVLNCYCTLELYRQSLSYLQVTEFQYLA